ncbi:FUSC family protein [Streptomyces wuyuanensis]|uniref:FUSC family protein n=1 Tax=Streptomyces wuyuanensis TaxID=1196353 RepID=UPI00341C9084
MRPSRDDVSTAARILVCSAVSWFACVGLGISEAPVSAAIVAVLLLPGGIYEAPRQASQRMLGVLAGVFLSVVILRLFGASTLAFILLLVLGSIGTLVFRYRRAPNQQVLITMLMVFASPAPNYPEARLLETMIGIVVVIVLGPILWPPDVAQELTVRLSTFRQEVNEVLTEASQQVVTTRMQPIAARIQSVRSEPDNMAVRLAAARRGISRYPIHRHKLPALQALAPRIELAQRCTITLQLFAEELETGLRRKGPLPPGMVSIAPLVNATAYALDQALSGGDVSISLQAAEEAIAQHRSRYPDRFDALLRSGLRLTLKAIRETACD